MSVRIHSPGLDEGFKRLSGCCCGEWVKRLRKEVGKVGKLGGGGGEGGCKLPLIVIVWSESIILFYFKNE